MRGVLGSPGVWLVARRLPRLELALTIASGRRTHAPDSYAGHLLGWRTDGAARAPTLVAAWPAHEARGRCAVLDQSRNRARPPPVRCWRRSCALRRFCCRSHADEHDHDHRLRPTAEHAKGSAIAETATPDDGSSRVCSGDGRPTGHRNVGGQARMSARWAVRLRAGDFSCQRRDSMRASSDAARRSFSRTPTGRFSSASHVKPALWISKDREAGPALPSPHVSFPIQTFIDGPDCSRVCASDRCVADDAGAHISGSRSSTARGRK